MAEKAESRIVESIIAHIRRYGGDAYHVHGSLLQRRGEPDISGEVYLAGKGFMHLKIEVKCPGESPTPLQLHRLEHYASFGYVAFWCNSLEDFKRQLFAWQDNFFEKGETE